MPGENVAAGVTFQLMCSCCRARGKGHGGACVCVCVCVCFFFHGDGGCRCREKLEDRGLGCRLDRAELRWMIVGLVRISLH